MAYNVLAGGMLTGKYMSKNKGSGLRGRMDTRSWGGTLYRYQSNPAKSAISSYSAVAEAAGMSLGELSVRWALQRDGVSTLLMGQSGLEQLEQQIGWR